MIKTYMECGLHMLPPYWDLKYPGRQGLTVPAKQWETVRGKFQYSKFNLKIIKSLAFKPHHEPM